MFWGENWFRETEFAKCSGRAALALKMNSAGIVQGIELAKYSEEIKKKNRVQRR